MGPLKEFLRGFVPQNPVPSCLCLLPVPLPGDLGSDVFTCSDRWPPDHTGRHLGAAREPQAPEPHFPSTPEKHVSPPRHRREAWPRWRPSPSTDNIDFPLEERGAICAPQPCLEASFPRPRTHFTEWRHVLACGRVFPGQRALLTPAPPCNPPPQVQHTVPPYAEGGNRLQSDRSRWGSASFLGDAEVGGCGGMAHVTQEAMHVDLSPRGA